MKIFLLTICLISSYELFIIIKLNNNFFEFAKYYKVLINTLLLKKLPENEKEAILKKISKLIIKKSFIIILKISLCLIVLTLPLFWYVESTRDFIIIFKNLNILFYMFIITVVYIVVRNKLNGK